MTFNLKQFAKAKNTVTLETVTIEEVLQQLKPKEFSLVHSARFNKEYLNLFFTDDNGDEMRFILGVSPKVELRGKTTEDRVMDLINNYTIYTGTTDADGNAVPRWFSFGNKGEVAEPISFKALLKGLKMDDKLMKELEAAI